MNKDDQLMCYICHVDGHRQGFFDEICYLLEDKTAVEVCEEDNAIMLICMPDDPSLEKLREYLIFIEEKPLAKSFKKVLNECSKKEPIIIETKHHKKCHIVPVGTNVFVVHARRVVIFQEQEFINPVCWLKFLPKNQHVGEDNYNDYVAKNSYYSLDQNGLSRY